MAIHPHRVASDMSPWFTWKGTVPLGHPVSHHIIFRILCLCCFIIWSAVRACPAIRQGAELDAASKAHLAPIVFHGRLLDITIQSSLIKATFRIQKLYKLSKMTLLKEKSDVHVEFSTATAETKRGSPNCRGVQIDPNLLRTQKRYIVFAAARRNRVQGTIHNLLGIARPEPHAKRRILPRILCNNCAKAPTVKAMEDVKVEVKSRLRLRCDYSGNPMPKITWLKNGVKLKYNDRIRVRSKKRSSRLVIRKVSRMDNGQYECKATNILGDANELARVFVTFPGDKRPNQPRPTNDSTWPLQGLPCPMSSYCLNGGTCTLYETVGEYVCECAEGYRGRRCESKATSTLSSPAPLDAPQSPHDLDATTRMLQHYWGK